jgi:hypothetical protein
MAICGCLVAGPAHADPFLVRNEHPMVQLFGLPAPLPARLPAPGAGNLAGVVNWVNFAVDEFSNHDSFTLDGEVLEGRLVFDHALVDRFAVHAELAYRRLNGGTLDGFINDWHDFWNMPVGSRNRLPMDDLHIRYTRNDVTMLDVTADTTGVSDLPVSVGWQWLAAEKGALSAWLTVKAPTGSASDLTGSGATDVAVSLAGERSLSDRWQIFGQASVAWLGNGNVLPTYQENAAWAAMGGVTWNAWHRLDLTVQVDANSRVFGTGQPHFDGGAVLMTFGGDYRTQGGWQFDFGITEDVQTENSPDVVFNFAVRHAF